jgi:carbamoyl-phosphate synthase large subunit
VPCNVLVTAASRRVPLVLAFKRAIESLGCGGSVVVADVNPLSPAVHVADRAYLVPLSNDPAYLDEIETICAAESITVLVPTIDDELELFAAARGRFAARGTTVVVSPPDTTAACNDKLRTCARLRESGVPAAATWLADALPAPAPLPLFVKPRSGRGGIGAFAAHTERELAFFTSYVADPVVQEFLAGPEYTIDLLCDFAGSPIAIVPRERVVIRAGVIDRGRTSRDPALIDLARACASALPFVGPVNIQCRVVGGVPTVFEINPRFSGGIPLTIAAGADFPRLLLELALGRTVRPRIGEFVGELWMTSYESAIFLDGDRARTLASCASRAEVRVA